MLAHTSFNVVVLANKSDELTKPAPIPPDLSDCRPKPLVKIRSVPIVARRESVRSLALAQDQTPASGCRRAIARARRLLRFPHCQTLRTATPSPIPFVPRMSVTIPPSTSTRDPCCSRSAPPFRSSETSSAFRPPCRGRGRCGRGRCRQQSPGWRQPAAVGAGWPPARTRSV